MKHTFFVLVFSGICHLSLAETLTVQTALASFQSASSVSEYSQALDGFESLHSNNPEDPDLTFYLARSLFHDRQLKAAEELLMSNIDRYPDHVESHYVLGSVKLNRLNEVSVFKKIGMAKAAITAWETAVSLDPNHVEAMYGVVEFYLSAPGIAGGDKEIGQQKLAELATLSEPWANLSRASIAAREESYAEAERLFDLAIAGIPERAFPQLMLANTYIKQEKFPEALDALNTYRQRQHTWNDPGIPQTELMAAKIHLGLNQPEKAKQAAQLVVSSNAPEALINQAKDILKDL